MPGTGVSTFHNIILLDAYRNSEVECFVKGPVIKTENMVCQTKKVYLQGICYTGIR